VTHHHGHRLEPQAERGVHGPQQDYGCPQQGLVQAWGSEAGMQPHTQMKYNLQETAHGQAQQLSPVHEFLHLTPGTG
jgi:hypothetical protein